jgi:hypothetical protein
VAVHGSSAYSLFYSFHTVKQGVSLCSPGARVLVRKVRESLHPTHNCGSVRHSIILANLPQAAACLNFRQKPILNFFCIVSTVCHSLSPMFRTIHQLKNIGIHITFDTFWSLNRKNPLASFASSLPHLQFRPFTIALLIRFKPAKGKNPIAYGVFHSFHFR